MRFVFCDRLENIGIAHKFHRHRIVGFLDFLFPDDRRAVIGRRSRHQEAVGIGKVFLYSCKHLHRRVDADGFGPF